MKEKNIFSPRNDSASVSNDNESSFTTQKQGRGFALNSAWNCEINFWSSPTEIKKKLKKYFSIGNHLKKFPSAYTAWQ